MIVFIDNHEYLSLGQLTKYDLGICHVLAA